MSLQQMTQIVIISYLTVLEIAEIQVLRNYDGEGIHKSQNWIEYFTIECKAWSNILRGRSRGVTDVIGK